MKAGERPMRRSAHPTAAAPAARTAALFADALRHHQLGQPAEAERLCRAILAIDRAHAGSLHLLGGIAHQAGSSATAIELIRQAIALQPSNAAYRNSLGLALRRDGRLAEAEREFRAVLGLAPDFVHAHNNLGLLLQSDRKLAEAAAAFERAIEIEPRFAVAHHNLGVVLRLQGRLEEAFACYRRYAALRAGQPRGEPGAAAQPHPVKLRHDQEQLAHLLAAHPEDKELQRLRAAAASEAEFSLSFGRLFRIDAGARIPAGAVNPALPIAAIEATWSESRPQIAVIDDFLTPDALQALRRFCWDSTVWRTPYPNGYLGAFLGDGFAAPLLAQIAAELAAKLPGVIGGLPLVQLWGFKYDSALRGINIHADAAAINVNFWITADEANRDAESGGLVIWDVPAPLDWPIEQYQNSDATEIRDFLAAHGARAIKVPYRCNRAVVFDSDLFHETDRFSFAEGYCNRRINVTMLYGLRHQVEQS